MKLSATVHGDGLRRVALVHGLGGSGKTWRPLVRRILALGGRSVVTVDLRGHGTLGLPTSHWSRVAPAVTMGAVALAAMPGRARIRARFAPEDQALVDEAEAGMARGVMIDTFRDLTHHPLVPGPAPVPSTVVLSAEGSTVVPDAVLAELVGHGWEVRRVPEVHHDFHLEDADATFAAIRDLL
ncbi:alpha/beta fold hydrolase [Pseudonocardia xishanensis]|uniref:AB hydrolase-1 domain-containing protein n=1 Tax=Pseudonocardia xishanensis TaxID=630995 RepID=A0ABP8RRN2_9PSEU